MITINLWPNEILCWKYVIHLCIWNQEADVCINEIQLVSPICKEAKFQKAEIHLKSWLARLCAWHTALIMRRWVNFSRFDWKWMRRHYPKLLAHEFLTLCYCVCVWLWERINIFLPLWFNFGCYLLLLLQISLLADAQMCKSGGTQLLCGISFKVDKNKFQKSWQNLSVTICLQTFLLHTQICWPLEYAHIWKVFQCKRFLIKGRNIKISSRRSDVQVWKLAASPRNKFQESKQNPLRGESFLFLTFCWENLFKSFAETPNS